MAREIQNTGSFALRRKQNSVRFQRKEGDLFSTRKGEKQCESDCALESDRPEFESLLCHILCVTLGNLRNLTKPQFLHL